MLHWYDHHLNGAETRLSKNLLGVITILWVLGQLFGQHAADVFALVPGLTLSNYYIWTFVTAGLFDSSFTMGLINICVYVAVAPMLERSWGGYTFLKFIGVTNLCIMVSIFFSMVACYAATEYEQCLFRHVCGFSGINAAFAVALKQRFGERSCVPGVKVLDAIKFKHLPMVLGWVSLALWFSGSLGGKEAPLIFFGTFYGFVYLRFFNRDAETGVVGDLRPEFGLATFFPDIGGVRAIVDFAGTVTFQTLLRLGLFADAVKTNASLPTSAETASLMDPAGSHSQHSQHSDLYRTVDPTAERRRLLAIKAIDDKLAELARHPSNNSYPDMSISAGASNSHHAQEAARAVDTHDDLASDLALPSEEELAKMEAALAQPNSTTPE